MIPGMTATKTAPSALLSSAQAFEEELRHLEDLATQLERGSLSSEKALSRAGTMLSEAGTIHERLGGTLAKLIAAVEGTGVRQHAALERVLAESQRVKTRHDEYRALMERFAALGLRAKEVNGPVAAVSAQKEAGASPDDLLHALNVVEELTDGVVQDAEAVAQAAKDGDWPEVARDAHALRQSMQSARNKVSLARRDVAGRATS